MKSKPKLIFDQFPIFRVRRCCGFFAQGCRATYRNRDRKGFVGGGGFRLVKPIKKVK
jgi:hypothetical protein